MHTLIDSTAHTHKHAQFLSLFFVRSPISVPLSFSLKLTVEVTVIMTYNEIKKRSFYHPALADRMGGGSKKERHFHWQYFGHRDRSIFLCHDLAERREAVFLQFPPPFQFLYYLFCIKSLPPRFTPFFLIYFILHHCVLAFPSNTFSFK